MLCESGAVWTGFRVFKLAVSKGATHGSEADNVFCGIIHVDNHHSKEEEVSDCVVVVVCTTWLVAATLCRV